MVKYLFPTEEILKDSSDSELGTSKIGQWGRL